MGLSLNFSPFFAIPCRKKMTEKSQGISKLKLAEKEANEIIEKARKGLSVFAE